MKWFNKETGGMRNMYTPAEWKGKKHIEKETDKIRSRYTIGRMKGKQTKRKVP